MGVFNQPGMATTSFQSNILGGIWILDFPVMSNLWLNIRIGNYRYLNWLGNYLILMRSRYSTTSKLSINTPSWSLSVCGNKSWSKSDRLSIWLFRADKSSAHNIMQIRSTFRVSCQCDNRVNTIKPCYSNFLNPIL